jgi:hypothetical protein
VDSPFLYMYSPELSYLIKGNVDSSRVDTLKLDTDLMTRMAQVSPKCLIVRAVDSTQTRQVFKLVDCETGKVKRELDLIRNQQFGGFDSDGYLKFDKETGMVVYAQMYMNRMYCMDTNLNVKYFGKTIDTTNTNLVNIGLVKEDGITKVMSTKPRVVVNRLIETGNGKIFVFSGLRADNETFTEFNRNLSVDLYNINTGGYIGSLHLSSSHGGRVQDVEVFENKLIVLMSDGICSIYNL